MIFNFYKILPFSLWDRGTLQYPFCSFTTVSFFSFFILSSGPNKLKITGKNNNPWNRPNITTQVNNWKIFI